jgi:hypothetical protein
MSNVYFIRTSEKLVWDSRFRGSDQRGEGTVRARIILWESLFDLPLQKINNKSVDINTAPNNVPHTTRNIFPLFPRNPLHYFSTIWTFVNPYYLLRKRFPLPAKLIYSYGQ